MSMSKDSRTKLEKLLALARDPNATNHERLLAKSKADRLQQQKSAKPGFNWEEFVGAKVRQANADAQRARDWGWANYYRSNDRRYWSGVNERDGVNQRSFEDLEEVLREANELKGARKNASRRTSSYEAVFCPMCGKEVQSFRRWIDKTKNEVILEYRHDSKTHIGRFSSIG